MTQQPRPPLGPLLPAESPAGLGHTRAVWRREVGEFRAGEQRRRHPLRVHVGEPGGWRETIDLPWPEPLWHDTGLRVDVVSALLARTDPRTVIAAHGWITRPGAPELHDADLAWYAAAVLGWGAHGVVLSSFHAVTRSGWVDVVTGERRAWKRLRLGPGARGARRPRGSGGTTRRTTRASGGSPGGR